MYIAPRTCVYACVRVSPEHEHVCVRLVCMCVSLLASSVRGEACEASLCVCVHSITVCARSVCVQVCSGSGGKETLSAVQFKEDSYVTTVPMGGTGVYIIPLCVVWVCLGV